MPEFMERMKRSVLVLSAPGTIPAGKHDASLTFERLNGTTALKTVMTDRFIAAPFVIEAMLQAALAALLALGLVFALERAFEARVVAVSFLPVTWAAAFLGAVVLLSWMAAMLALSRVLRAVGP